MKKKIISLLAATAMLTACALPVCADDITSDGGSVSTKVTYNATSNYVVSIPATVDVSDGAKTETVSLTTANIKSTEKVTISVSGLDTDKKVTLTNKDDSSKTLKSAVTVDGAAITDFDLTKNARNKDITFGAVEGEKVAGEYQGTVTFEAQLGTE